MRVRCHACARVWEVLDPEEWGESMRAECAYCGRPHTLDECRENQIEREPKMSQTFYLDLLRETVKMAAKKSLSFAELKRLKEISQTVVSGPDPDSLVEIESAQALLKFNFAEYIGQRALAAAIREELSRRNGQ